MKKSSTVLIIIVVVVIIAIGGYFLLRKSPTSNTPSNSSSSSSTAVNNAVIKTRTVAGIGQYLAAPNGEALYTYGSDTAGMSNCTGSCLAQWPAYYDTGSTANLPSNVGVIKRSDNGKEQYTYEGKPLYFFISDSVGKVTGNGVASFSVARPTASTSHSSTSSSTSSSSGYGY